MLFLGIGIGVIICLSILLPKLKKKVQLDKETNDKNTLLKLKLEKLTNEVLKYENQNKELKFQYDLINEELSNASEMVTKNLEYKDNIISSNKELIEQLDKQYEQRKKDLDFKTSKYKEECDNEYLELLRECSIDFNNQLEDVKKVIEENREVLKELEELEAAAVQARIRAKEMEEQTEFYRLKIPKDDLEEIKKLREVSVYLRDKEPLNKIIWKVYYEKPTNDLIGRVIGDEKKTGIYKITNIFNGMCYVGQCRDAASRWKQHIKRGLGAETPTRNKLYPILMQEGVENFTFELIEECPVDKLNEREDYWQDYFKAITYGYSIK